MLKKIYHKVLWLVNIVYHSLLFHDVLKSHSRMVLKCYIKRSIKKHEACVRKLKQKDKIIVAFFFQTPAVWKYDRLYRLLEEDERFEPIVVICPYNVNLSYDKAVCLNVMQQSENYAQKQQYRYLSTFDKTNHKWIDVRKVLNPDIVFFVKPYKDTLLKYHIYRFPDKLTCYTPYGFSVINNYRANTNFPFYNLLWKFFAETKFQLKISQEHATNKGENIVITGCLVTENLLRPDYLPKEVWKAQSKPKKRIIWAPHHTVDYLFNFSNFLTYCEFMLELAQNHQDRVQFVFKPHPVLKVRLMNIWGAEKAEAYYQQWKDLENTQIEEGDYIDIFKTSDALIHDCGSFTLEYLHVPQKPVLYLVRDENITQSMNPFCQMAFDLHYHARNEAEIEHFIEQVVLQGEDPMRTRRETFFNEYLYPQDGIMPSQKIMNVLREELSKEL